MDFSGTACQGIASLHAFTLRRIFKWEGDIIAPNAHAQHVQFRLAIAYKNNHTFVAEKLMSWPNGYQLRLVPELRFSYEEEAAPEAFFVPYVWSLIVSHTSRTLAWRTEAIALFTPLESYNSADTLDGLSGQNSNKHPSETNGTLCSV